MTDADAAVTLPMLDAADQNVRVAVISLLRTLGDTPRADQKSLELLHTLAHLPQQAIAIYASNPHLLGTTARETLVSKVYLRPLARNQDSSVLHRPTLTFLTI